MWKSDHIAAGCQGAAFFVSIFLIGFVWGHEKVIRHIMVRESDYDRKIPSWKQQECYKRAKIKSRRFFPIFWYWGNIRSALVFWVFAILSTAESGAVSAPELSAGMIMLTNLILFFASSQARWDKDKDD